MDEMLAQQLFHSEKSMQVNLDQFPKLCGEDSKKRCHLNITQKHTVPPSHKGGLQICPATITKFVGGLGGFCFWIMSWTELDF